MARSTPTTARRFVTDSQADSFYLPERNTNYRAMLSYELDLTNNSGWTRSSAGTVSSGSFPRKTNGKNDLRYRLSYDGGNPLFLPTPANLALNTSARQSWAGNAANIQRYFYLGQGGNVNVTKGLQQVGEPGFGGIDHANLRYYDFTSNSCRTATWIST